MRNYLLILGGIVAGLAILETGARLIQFLSGTKAQIRLTGLGESSPKRAKFGLFPPLSYLREEKIAEGRQVYLANFKIDHAGRRVVPQTSNANKHLLVFGCSFVFGTGVDDNQTLPYYLGKLAPGYRPYNYGMPGAAMQEAYYWATNTNLSADVAEPEGIAIFYLFNYEHLVRTHPGGVPFRAWPRVPLFSREDSGKLRYLGQRREVYPFRHLLLSFLESSLVFEALWLRYGTFTPAETDLNLAAELLRGLRDRYLASFPRGKFLVITGTPIGALGPKLDRVGVSYEVFDMQSIHLSEYMIPGDGHFNASGNRFTAEKMMVLLEKHMQSP